MKKFLIFIIVIMVLSCTKKSTNTSYCVITTSPEVAETIAFLGGTDYLVGVTKECTFPPELNAIEKVGGFGEVNLEKIINLNPDVVFTADIEQDKIASDLTKLGFRTIQISSSNLSEMQKNILLIADYLDLNENGEKLIADMKKSISQLVPIDSPPRIFVEIYGSPLMTVNENSFVASLISAAGGKNVFSDLPRNYCRINPEDVINNNPDIIILTYDVNEKDVYNRRGWENINAIKNGQVYTVEDINPDLLLRAGPRSIDGIKQLNKIFSTYEKER